MFEVEKEAMLREYADIVDWDVIDLYNISKDFVIEMKEYFHPKNINFFTRQKKRIDDLIKYYGKKFYIEVFDNYGYPDRW